MREKLGFVHRMNRILALKLDDHTICDDDICAESTIKLNAFVDERNSSLPLDRKPQLYEFVCETGLISRFE